jgi:hypothetical protein
MKKIFWGLVIVFITGLVFGIQKPAEKKSESVVIAAVGDVACQPEWETTDKACQQVAVSDLVVGDPEIQAVLILGDVQYGTSKTAQMAGFDQSFGRFKNKIYPAPGNHEYSDSGIETYFEYFKNTISGLPYYSLDIGDWHVVALDTVNIDDKQTLWLENDLSKHQRLCTLVFGHHPRYSSGTTHGSQIAMKTIWETLAKYKVDIWLAGHEHNYERIELIDGVREFVAGTGGRSLYAFGTPLPQSEFRDEKDFGVVKIKLFENKYQWQFVNIENQIIDQGEGNCS